MNPLSQTIGRIVMDCLENGFVLPLHAASIAVNGAVFVFRYTAADAGGLKREVLAEHKTADAMLALLINVMVVDARGEAVRIVVGADGNPKMIH